MSEFELLDRRERALRAEADVLDKELTEIRRRRDSVQERLERIAQARTTLEDCLMDESGSGGEPSEADHPGPEVPDEGSSDRESASGVSHGTASGCVSDDSAQGPVDLEEARRRAVALLATSGRKLRARAIAEAIGEDVSRPARVETTRGRLKTLVTEGALEEEPPGVFFIATPDRPDDRDDARPEPKGTA